MAELKPYSNQGKLRYWCQKVLPLVYDNSLSYYELLNKVVVYLNNTIADVGICEDNIDLLLQAFENLQDYVNDQISEVTPVVEEVIDEMIESGQFGEILVDAIAGVIADEYDSTQSYTPLNYVLYDGYIYCCTANTTGDWDSTKWRKTTIGDELETLMLRVYNLNAGQVSFDDSANYSNGTVGKELIDSKGAINNLNDAVGDFSNRYFLVLGDSYNQITATKWSDIFTEKLGITQKYVATPGGYGFLATNKTWLSLVQSITGIVDADITDILICGGANDSFYTLSNLIPAMQTFDTYVRTRFTGLKNIWLGFVGNSYYTNAQMANMRATLREYIKGANQLSWKYMHGIETTLFYAPWMQKIGSDDFIHPTVDGVTQIGYNIVQCLLSGSCDNLHASNDISMTPDSTNFNSTAFNFSEKLNGSICSITMGDKQLWINQELSGSPVIARCNELQNMVRPYIFFPVYCTMPGETSFIGILTFTDLNTLNLILPQTVPAYKNLTIHGFSAIVDLLSY